VKKGVYLDNNATTPLRCEVIAALQKGLTAFGNPSSVYAVGQEARFALDEARRQVADMCNVRSEQVVFTSGGTESNNMALRGAAGQGAIVTVLTEHPSVLKTALHLKEQGQNVVCLHVDNNGLFSLDVLEELLRDDHVKLVSTMWVNNETGVVNPLADIAALCKRYEVLLHVDAVQAAGKMKIDFPEMGADMLSLSAHKLGGPKGVGALILRNEVTMDPLLTGGSQEKNRRAGTENLMGIIGMGAAAKVCQTSLETETAKYQACKEALEQGLVALPFDIKIVGQYAPRVDSTTCFITSGLDAEAAVMALDMEGFAVSRGSACSSGRSEPSHVLTAMGYSESESKTALRVSFGWQTEVEDVKDFVQAFTRVAERMLKKSA